MSLKAYRYRLYPTDAQKVDFARHFGCTRLVFNKYIEAAEAHYKEKKTFLSAFTFNTTGLMELKKENPFLSERINSQSLQSAVLNGAAAYKNFFAGHARRPCFKKKSDGRQSFQCPQNVKVLFPEKDGKKTGTIRLPVIKDVKAKLHRRFEGKVKTVTIIREPSGKYYASVLVDDAAELPLPDVITPELTVGMDAGLKTAFTVGNSTGTAKIDNPKFLQKHAKEIAKRQKILARKQFTLKEITTKEGKTVTVKVPSQGRVKARQALARAYEKVRFCRQNWIHTVTRLIVDKNQATTIVIEDLNLRGMMKNLQLARAVSDVGIGNFYRVLEYKLRDAGKNLVRAGRWYPSSRLCPHCGYKNTELTLKDRQWECPVCGCQHDRDEAAAVNLSRWPALSEEEQRRYGRNDRALNAGKSAGVKRSPRELTVGAGSLAKGSAAVISRNESCEVREITRG